MEPIEFMGKPLTYWGNLQATVESHGLTGAYERIAELKRENRAMKELLKEATRFKGGWDVTGWKQRVDALLTIENKELLDALCEPPPTEVA